MPPKNGDVPDGWTADHWREECERMADACKQIRPDLSARWREVAALVEG